MIKEKLNGFLTLRDIVYWIVIMGAVVGPYFLHERRIGEMSTNFAVRMGEMSTDIAVIKVQITEINQRLGDSRGLSWAE